MAQNCEQQLATGIIYIYIYTYMYIYIYVWVIVEIVTPFWVP